MAKIFDNMNRAEFKFIDNTQTSYMLCTKFPLVTAVYGRLCQEPHQLNRTLISLARHPAIARLHAINSLLQKMKDDENYDYFYC
jgi:hypothetical protein